MRQRSRLTSSIHAALAFASVAALAVACGGGTSGSSDLFGDQSYGGANGSGNDGGSATGDNGSSGDNGGGAVLGGGMTSTGGDDTTDAGVTTTTTTNAMCNSVNATAARVPVNIVIMLDKSGSMGDGQNGDPNKKWIPVTQALDAFLEDANSTNMAASLQFFPYDGSGSNKDCSTATYANVAVDFTSLPATAGSDPFKTAIASVSPDGDTPTIEALKGAVSYAQNAMASDTSGAKYVILFVTDGDPCGCSAGTQAGCPGNEGSTADTNAAKAVAAEAATAYAGGAGIPTYVIGVGNGAPNLNLIAAGGGTNTATIVQVGDSTTTKTQLQTALNAIRTSTVSCNFAIPAPPSGSSYDIDAVNVQFTPTGGSAQTLPYDPNCTGAGWHYDDPTAPTQIELCGTSCTEVKSSSGGAVNVEFGCQTVGTIPNYDGGVVIRVR